MRRAFIMPLVLILMAMLLGVALVLSKIAEDKTKSLKSQETGYYSGKEVVIRLVDSKNEVPPKECDHLNQIVPGTVQGGSWINGGEFKKNENGKEIVPFPYQNASFKAEGTISAGNYRVHQGTLGNLRGVGSGVANIYGSGTITINGDITVEDDLVINIYVKDQNWKKEAAINIEGSALRIDSNIFSEGQVNIKNASEIRGSLYAEEQLAISGGHGLIIDGVLTTRHLAVSLPITINGECGGGDQEDDCWVD